MSYFNRRVVSLSVETLEPRQMLTANPLITEFLASNDTGLVDFEGDNEDWLEVSNPTSVPVNLGGWYLTDDKAELNQWQFPSVTVPAGESIVVFASGKDLIAPNGELHANFKLGAGGEYLALTQPDAVTVVSEFTPEYPAQSTDISFGYIPASTNLVAGGADASIYVPVDGSLGGTWTQATFNDSSWTSGTTGVGFNTNGTFDSLIGTDIDAAMRNTASSAYVRVPFNIDNLDDVDGLLLHMQYDDGFVAYINGMQVASSNAPASPAWDSTATQTQPDGLPTVFQYNVSAAMAVLQTGANVLAIHGLNSSADSTDFLVSPELSALDLSAGPPTFLQVATPGELNLASAVGEIGEPQFSHDRGFYDAGFNLTISTETVGAVIRYTTDGSEPTPDTGQIYSGPVPITTTSVIRALAYKPDQPATRVSTQTYLFLEDILQQPEDVAGYPNDNYSVGVGSARHDYEMDPAIVNDPAYSQSIRDGLLGIPSLAISSSIEDIFGNDGFYDSDAEKAVSIEIIDPTGATTNLQVDGGIEPHSHDRLKRSLRLSFKDEYGPTQWLTNLLQNGPLNGDTASDGLDHIVLRAGNNRAWSRSWNPDATTFTEDQWYRDTQIALSGYGSHGTFVHLYINGLYWGLYNPVERPGEKFQADYFGGDDEGYYTLNHDGRTRGDSTRWDYLSGPLIDKDLSDPTNYAELQEYLDTENFTDYLLLNWYQATTDWPNNNYYLGNRNDEPGPVRYFAWDGEWSWDQGNGFSTDGAWVHPFFRDGSSNGTDAAKIWRSLTDSDEFMLAFADRAFKHLANDGALTDAQSLARWNTLNDYVRDAVVAESARWGDSLESLGQPTRTRDVDWQNEVNNIAGMMVGNAAQLIAAMRDEGFYPSIDPATFSQRGGVVPNGFTLSLSATVGDIYYTLDGTDPRLPGGGVSPSALLYDPNTGVPIEASGPVRLRVQNGGEWSALDQAEFEVSGVGANAPPFVSAGSSQSILVTDTVTLAGFATDDGQPNAMLTTQWAKLSGPGDVSFDDATQLETTASFSAAGTYTLQLSADDGQFIRTSNVAITVVPIAEQVVNSFSLIDADTDLPITGFESITGDTTINLATLPTPNLNIRANTIGNIGSVKFELDGDANFRTESASPYALFGDSNGDYGAGMFELGAHLLTATPFANSGGGGMAGVPLTVILTFIEDAGQTNTTPTVNAGSNQSITLPALANLAGTTSDDGLPAGGMLATTWSQLSGPGVTTFGNASQLATTASFSVDGTYVLRLTASDGDLSSTSDVTITVALMSPSNAAPTVNAGSNQSIALPAVANLAGTASDDGLPADGMLTTTWSQLSGPGTTTFGNASQLATTASFSVDGTYILRLTAFDGELTSTSDVTITVAPETQSLSVTSFTLINSDSNEPVAGFESFSSDLTLNLATLPTQNLSIRANTTGDVGSVRFALDGNANFRTESAAPYALFGDYLGNYAHGKLDLGVHQVVATPFSSSGGNGESGIALAVTLNIIDQDGNNIAPSVDAGSSQSITLPALANLVGTASDDGQPAGGALTTTWSQISGPGTATIGDASQLVTTASFSGEGTYVLRLTATDGELTSTNDVTITALPEVPNNMAPTVNAGSNQNVTLPDSVNLNGTASDDGQPAGGMLATTWSQLSGPGVITFGDESQLATTASFSVDGTYVLRLTALDGELTSTSDVTITVASEALTNMAPTVNAGSNQKVTLPDSINLNGTASDDGLPAGGMLATTWSQLSGPGTTTFGDESQPATTASFSVDGTYVLRLTAFDGELTSTSDVTITVAPLPSGPTVTSLTLINAETDLPIAGFETITGDLTLTLSSLPTANINVRANVNDDVESVKFTLDGDSRTESAAPYALFGDRGGNYHDGTFEIGEHLLTATPYPSTGARGTPGQLFAINLTVVGELPALLGDFDGNGLVNLADHTAIAGNQQAAIQIASLNAGVPINFLTNYTIWRDNLGAENPEPGLPGDEAEASLLVMPGAALMVSPDLADFWSSHSIQSGEVTTTSVSGPNLYLAGLSAAETSTAKIDSAFAELHEPQTESVDDELIVILSESLASEGQV